VNVSVVVCDALPGLFKQSLSQGEDARKWLQLFVEFLDLVGQLQLQFPRVSYPQAQSKLNYVDVFFACVLEHSFK
jgi:hypothetical protein